MAIRAFSLTPIAKLPNRLLLVLRAPTWTTLCPAALSLAPSTALLDPGMIGHLVLSRAELVLSFASAPTYRRRSVASNVPLLLKPVIATTSHVPWTASSSSGLHGLNAPTPAALVVRNAPARSKLPRTAVFLALMMNTTALAITTHAL